MLTLEMLLLSAMKNYTMLMVSVAEPQLMSLLMLSPLPCSLPVYSYAFKGLPI